MYTLSQLIEDNKIPTFIRKNVILNDQNSISNIINNSSTVASLTVSDSKKIKEGENAKKPEIEKSLFDSLDLLNEEYLESYGIEELNTSRSNELASTLETSLSSHGLQQQNSIGSTYNKKQLLMTSSNSSSSSTDNDFIYLFKTMLINCALARKYESKVIEEYLNAKYGCNSSIDISNENIINNSAYDLTNIKYDDYIIPSNYEGKFIILVRFFFK